MEHPSEFQQQPGEFAITMDIPDTQRVTTAFQTDCVMAAVDLLDQVNKDFTFEIIVLSVISIFRELVEDATDDQDECAIVAVVLNALWIAVNSPAHGKTIRKKLSERLRDGIQTHMTWVVRDDGLLVVVGDRFTEVGERVTGYGKKLH